MTVKIELITAYGKFTSGGPDRVFTYGTPVTVALVIENAQIVHVIEPTCEDYECEGELHCVVISVDEFDRRYSLVHSGYQPLKEQTKLLEVWGDKNEAN